MSEGKLKGVLIGAGYFSRFHMDAWQRIPEVQITAVCDVDSERANTYAAEWNLPTVYTDPDEAIESEKPDFVDIVTPPDTHRALVEIAARRGVAVICQKPLAPSLPEAQALVALTEQCGIPFMVHENFRFQPWHRELKKLLTGGVVGDAVYAVYWRMRMGDGWQPDAYLARQPYFRTYPRLLIYETGIHLIDTVRYLLGGRVTGVFARLARRNEAIAGEDSGVVVLEVDGRTQVILDMSRYNESQYANPRYTFADDLRIDAAGGSLRLTGDGTLFVQPLGKPAYEHRYAHENRGFAGDCVRACQQHFVDQLRAGQVFETSGPDYLLNLAVQETIYNQQTS
ncbi:Gfo/Idh/MocA family oxidoreductase [Nibrella viscosa]|uniref:Gfo/Idh/MocA family oxidoreductase n=1 Tax=Nibrella viscosa TaxID=1084524 RepID=A0ABP8K3Q7_9BACT